MDFLVSKLSAKHLSKEYFSKNYSIEEKRKTIKLNLREKGIVSIKSNAFSDFNQLEELNFLFNKIEQLNENLFAGLNNLKSIDLGGNQLTSIHDNALAGLTNLNSISLYSNQLSSIHEKTFNGLNNLNNINLSWNQLTSIYEKTFAGLTNLNTINLSNNELTRIHEETFACLTNLKYIDLRGNKLTSIHEKTFAGLTNLNYIDLSGNQLASIHEETFASLANLNYLDLYANQLTSIHEKTFNGLVNLKHLSLNYNKLSALNENLFRGLASLEKLWLYGNKSLVIPKGIFYGLVHLKELILIGYGTNSLFDYLNEINNQMIKAFSNQANVIVQNELNGVSFKNQPNLSVLKEFNPGAFSRRVCLVQDSNDSINSKKFVKILKDSADSGQTRISSKQTEINILKNVDHKFIIKYFGHFLDDDDKNRTTHLGIITEYCEQGDLSQLISETKKQRKQFEESRILKWTLELTSALNYLHNEVVKYNKKHAIVHGDIKPENIFVREDRLKLGDFGLSKLIDMTLSSNQQQQEIEIGMSGTLPYMSPEQIENNGSASSIEMMAKSDVWSLGCVVYEMCALDKLFHGPSRSNYMYEIRNFKFNEQTLNLNRSLIVPMLKQMLQVNLAERDSSSSLFNALSEIYIRKRF